MFKRLSCKGGQYAFEIEMQELGLDSSSSSLTSVVGLHIAAAVDLLFLGLVFSGIDMYSLL